MLKNLNIRFKHINVLLLLKMLLLKTIRSFAVGRKNWLFTVHCERTQASANLFKLLENAKLYNLKVFNYLKSVFDRIGDAKMDKDYEMLRL